MSKTVEMKKIRRTIDNIYAQCANSNEVKLDKVKIENTWTTHQITQKRILDKRKIILHLTLTGVKDGRS